MQQLNANCVFVVVFLVCKSHRKGLQVWNALNEGEVLVQASAQQQISSGPAYLLGEILHLLFFSSSPSFLSLFPPRPVSSHISCSHP